jgi:hypothetical protein
VAVQDWAATPVLRPEVPVRVERQPERFLLAANLAVLQSDWALVDCSEVPVARLRSRAVFLGRTSMHRASPANIQAAAEMEAQESTQAVRVPTAS